MSGHGYSHKVRVRVNGLLVRDRELLLVKLRHPTRDGFVWMPPGGGVEYGESMEQALKREFLEETGIQIQVGPLRYIHEFIAPPLHAVEFYYDCTQAGGRMALGSDPEHSGQDQLLEDIRYVALADLHELPVVPEHLRYKFTHEFDSRECTPQVIRS